MISNFSGAVWNVNVEFNHIQFIPAINVHVARAIRGCHGGIALEGLKEMDKAFHEMRKLKRE